jgi:hypothetical protein
VLEFGIELESPNEIRGTRQFVLVPGARVEDLGNQFAHSGPLIAEEVIDFGQDQRRHDDKARGGQNRLVFREAGLEICTAAVESVVVAKMTEASLNGFPSSQIADEIQAPYRFLICVDKFQTVHGEPSLHTMYVDKVLSGTHRVSQHARSWTNM